ncbi:MAG: AcrB/AcrD/AcrF family protein [Calditrichaeota bacterium]|nr:MAG: AcrB/AcrD/AcrF family protein [Calditrichota bacterium]
MINKIIEFSVRQKLLIILALIFFIGWGIDSYRKIPIDAFPDVTNNQVQILTTINGFSPLEVEKLITYPIEVEMSSIPGLVENRSISQFGLSAITLVFEDEIDIYWARQQILEKLIVVGEELPEGAEVEMGPVSTGLGEIYQYTLESESLSPMELREIQDWVIAPVLRSVKGVVEVNSFGGFVKQFHIVLNPTSMQNFDVTLDEIWESVENNNSNAGGNYIEKNFEQYVVRGIGLIEKISDIENIVVKTENGIPVKISDVAEVKIEAQVRYGAATKDGKGEAVAGIIMMLKGESGKNVVLRVKEAFKTLENSLPKDLKIVPYYDRIELVDKAISTVTNALVIGGILVVLILILFLGNFGSSLIVSLVLPISVLLSFIVMKMIGLSSNLMSLGGLAIGIGMMVDGGVVVIENINRLIQENKTKVTKESFAKLVIRGAEEVGRPSFFAVLVVITVFIPLFTLEGLEGKMFTPLAITISVALLISLLLSLTMVPAFATFLSKKQSSEKSNPLLSFAKSIYEPILNFALNKKGLTVGISAIIFALSAFLFSRLGTEFVPPLEEGSIAVQAFRLPSISTKGSVEICNLIEKRIKEIPEITTVVSRTGRAEVATDPMLPSISDIYVMMKPLEEWREGYTKKMIVNEMREKLEEIPGVLYSFSQPIALRVDELISGVKSQLAVKIFGEDSEVMNEIAEQIIKELQEMKGTQDAKVEQTTGFGYLQIKINREALGRYGLNVKEIQEYISIGIGGETVSTLYDGEKKFDIVVRLEESQRNTLKAISNILVSTPQGYRLPLSTFAEVYFEDGPSQVSRENGKRKVTVELNVEGVDIGTFVEAAQTKLKTISLPTGYYLKWGGQFENQQRANERLKLILPFTLVLIFVLLFITFGSIKNSALVLLNLPFSLVGGVLGVWLWDIYLSVPTSVGFIAVIGTAVQNGIVMVSFINEHREKGHSGLDAIKISSMLRLRPILMTSLTTILGLIPLLLATGIGSEIQQPLAIVVVGGLVTSTFSTLVILPSLYSWFEKAK